MFRQHHACLYMQFKRLGSVIIQHLGRADLQAVMYMGRGSSAYESNSLTHHALALHSGTSNSLWPTVSHRQKYLRSTGCLFQTPWKKIHCLYFHFVFGHSNIRKSNIMKGLETTGFWFPNNQTQDYQNQIPYCFTLQGHNLNGSIILVFLTPCLTIPVLSRFWKGKVS